MIILGNSRRYATVFGSSASSCEGLHIVEITEGFQVFMSIRLFEVDRWSFEVSIICRLGFEDLRIEQ